MMLFCIISAIVMASLSFIAAIGANDEANDARYRRFVFLGYCSASVAFAALMVGQAAMAWLTIN